MGLTSLWESGHFSDFPGSVYSGTHTSFDSVGEDHLHPDSWYIHMPLLQGDKRGSQKLCGRLLSISPLGHECCLTNFYLFHLFDRLSHRHTRMPGPEKGERSGERDFLCHLSAAFFSKHHKGQKIFPGFLFHHF